MKTIQFSIPMPLSLEEYEVAQAWAFVELSKRETGGGEGVRVLTDEPFCGEAGKRGQYTYKIYHLENKVPSLARALLRPIIGDGFEFHEEAWNAFPYCKTLLTNPGCLKDNFRVEIESMHQPGFDADQSSFADVIDIFKEKCSLVDLSDISGLISKKANRGPFEKAGHDWLQSTQPIMTCYKTVRVHCKVFGLQSRMESLILNQYRDMLLGFHQQIWCWIDEWFLLSLPDVRALEQQAKDELEQKIVTTQKCGTIL